MSIQFRVAGLVASAIIASVTSAQSAVEWKVSDGGNGHWYQLVIHGSITWPAARAASEGRGGHLVTATTASEEAFIAQLAARASNPTAWVDDQAVTAAGPWLGGYQPAGASSSQPWVWVTGEPWIWTGWAWGEPNGGFRPGEAWTCMLGFAGRSEYRGWADATLTDFQTYPLPVSFIVEWEADCNNDGIVDYGQIRSGQLADDNTNGIPDICETSITGVLPPSVPAQGGSTITINGRNFPAQPSLLVGGVAATNVVRISDSRLTAVTPPLLPGMAPLTVNGYTLPDAIYIRPECGSDLDQNGVVDAGDISIILLDFGPCYEPPAALAVPAPTPLLADEPAQKTGTAKKE